MASIPEKRISLPFLFLRKEKFTVVRLGSERWIIRIDKFENKDNPVARAFRKFEF